MAADNGQIVNFLEVPFPDGGLPEQFNLPALMTHDVVSGLNGEHARQYHELYYPNVHVPRRIDSRKRAICLAIGCRVTD